MAHKHTIPSTTFVNSGNNALQSFADSNANESIIIMPDEKPEPEWTVIEYPKYPLYSTRQVAEIINRKPSTIRMAILNNRIIPADLPGRDNYFTEDEVMRFAKTYKIIVKFQENT